MPFRGYTWQASQAAGDWHQGPETQATQVPLRDLNSGSQEDRASLGCSIERQVTGGISKSKTGQGVRDLDFLRLTNTVGLQCREQSQEPVPGSGAWEEGDTSPPQAFRALPGLREGSS